eukprot:1874690-Alexandrium_andersonii.AAC.1
MAAGTPDPFTGGPPHPHRTFPAALQKPCPPDPFPSDPAGPWQGTAGREPKAARRAGATPLRLRG